MIEYGKTVTAQDYNNGISAHPYIPQSDQAIYEQIFHFAQGKDHVKVLDCGCGPNRITSRIGTIPNTTVWGLDLSQEFVDAANESNNLSNVFFLKEDFIQADLMHKFDVIYLQGVLHHIRGRDRERFISKLFEMLQPGGIVIVGDEFIPKYETETERVRYVGLFYAHIIAEAVAGGFDVLAKEESKNLIDDCLAGHLGAGVFTDAILERIQTDAVEINRFLYTDKITAFKKVGQLVSWLEKETEKAAGSVENMDRGDYKISMPELEKDFERSALRKLTFGPVDFVGGMGVMIWEK